MALKGHWKSLQGVRAVSERRGRLEAKEDGGGTGHEHAGLQAYAPLARARGRPSPPLEPGEEGAGLKDRHGRQEEVSAPHVGQTTNLGRVRPVGCARRQSGRPAGARGARVRQWNSPGWEAKVVKLMQDRRRGGRVRREGHEADAVAKEREHAMEKVAIQEHWRDLNSYFVSVIHLSS